MRRKVIQDIVNNLCQMLSARMSEDLEYVAGFPDGTLSIDLLSGVASHDHAGNIPLDVCGELQDWLFQRLAALKIPLHGISAANVTVKIRTDMIPTDRTRIISFNFFVNSLIRTVEMQYTGQPLEVHRWHTRGAL